MMQVFQKEGVFVLLCVSVNDFAYVSFGPITVCSFVRKQTSWIYQGLAVT